jgi:hypothetical protein
MTDSSIISNVYEVQIAGFMFISYVSSTSLVFENNKFTGNTGTILFVYFI